MDFLFLVSRAIVLAAFFREESADTISAIAVA
jgi:hypothetical protein